jgi:hypothetical protein
VSVTVDNDFEEWLESPAPDRERQIHTVTRLHHEALNRMAISERIAYTRTTLVATCERYRRLPKEFDTPILHNNLREVQVDLLRLRDWRRTGLRPGYG